LNKKKEYILFLFEGVKTEPIIFENLKKYFLKKKENNVSQEIIISYGTVIYKLYKEFFIDDTLDEDLDLITILKPKDNDGNIIKRNQVPEIYLFFDYDSHASNATDKKLAEMLNLFNNESDKGKLFISYPMVEAIKHLKDDVDFKEVIVESNKKYKNLVSLNCNCNLKNLSELTQENWNQIIFEHCKKANYIVHNSFNFPKDFIEQKQIFSNQKEKYIEKTNKVAVLSSFPLFLLDYYGVTKFKDLITL